MKNVWQNKQKSHVPKFIMNLKHHEEGIQQELRGLKGSLRSIL